MSNYSKNSRSHSRARTLRYSGPDRPVACGGLDIVGMARLMLQGYDWEGAVDTCRQVLQGDPDHLGALEVLAQALWFGGQFDEVISTTSRLLKLNPHEPGYRYTRGMAHLSRGELLKAAEDFQMAIAQSTDQAFKDQVESSLNAVELWMHERITQGQSTNIEPGILPRLAPSSFGGLRPH